MELNPTLQPGTEQTVLLRRGVAFLLDVGLWVLLTSLPEIGTRLVYSRLTETTAATISYGGLGFLLYLTVAHGVFSQSIGKLLLGVGVADTEGSPCSFSQAGARSLFLVVDSALFGLPAVVSLYFSDTRQRIGDRLAGTVVVRAER